MSGGGDETWAQIKCAYEENNLTLRQICNIYQVTRAQLTYRRQKFGWQTRPVGRQRQVSEGIVAAVAASAGATGATETTIKHIQNKQTRSPCRTDEQSAARPEAATAATTATPAKRQPGKRDVSRPYDAAQFSAAVGRLMDRLFRITEKELSIIEERIEMGEIRTPADSARDTSSIGSLIKNLEKLTEFNEQIRGGGDRRGGVAGITADEADRIRRDLAQRIERLNKG